MNETVYRNFYIGSKILSGRYALETLSFELQQQDAVRPLCLIPETEKNVEKRIRKALKSTVTVIGAVILCRGNEEGLPEKIADAYREYRCDSLIVIAEPSLMCAVKSARLKLSTGKSAAEIGCTDDSGDITELPPQKAVPLFAVTVLSTEATYFPHELILNNKRILSPSLFANTIFIDPRVTKKSAARKEWRKPAAAALMTAVWALSDTKSHPAARACALSAIGQVWEAVCLRSRAEKTRLVCNAQVFSKTALINSRPFPEIEILSLIPVNDGARIGILRSVFEKSFSGLTFTYTDLIQAALTVCGNISSDNPTPDELEKIFAEAVFKLLALLLPEKQTTDPKIWKAAVDAVPLSYISRTSYKDKCVAFLQSQIGECQ